MTALAAIVIGAPSAAGADQSDLVPNTKIDGPMLTFDRPGVEIGATSYEEGPTGVTIIRFLRRASVVVDVRGGSPGTANTDALRLGFGGRRFNEVYPDKRLAHMTCPHRPLILRQPGKPLTRYGAM